MIFDLNIFSKLVASNLLPLIIIFFKIILKSLFSYFFYKFLILIFLKD